MWRSVKAARNFDAPGHRTANARLWPDDGAVADFEMIHHAYLAGQRYILADARAPGDPHLGGDDAIFTDHDVMRDLHEIIELGAAADHRASKSCPVHRGVGAYLDVILNFNPARLGNFHPLTAAAGVAETIAANNRPGVNNHSVP